MEKDHDRTQLAETCRDHGGHRSASYRYRIIRSSLFFSRNLKGRVSEVIVTHLPCRVLVCARFTCVRSCREVTKKISLSLFRLQCALAAKQSTCHYLRPSALKSWRRHSRALTLARGFAGVLEAWASRGSQGAGSALVDSHLVYSPDELAG